MKLQFLVHPHRPPTCIWWHAATKIGPFCTSTHTHIETLHRPLHVNAQTHQINTCSCISGRLAALPLQPKCFSHCISALTDPFSIFYFFPKKEGSRKTQQKTSCHLAPLPSADRKWLTGGWKAGHTLNSWPSRRPCNTTLQVTVQAPTAYTPDNVTGMFLDCGRKLDHLKKKSSCPRTTGLITGQVCQQTSRRWRTLKTDQKNPRWVESNFPSSSTKLQSFWK